MKKTLSKIFKSNPNRLAKIEKDILTMLDEFNLSKSLRIKIELAIAEAIANSVIHGNNADPKKSISVTINQNSKKLFLKIKDQGKGFDVNRIPDPTDPENILKGNGRGIYIMNSVADDLEFNFSEDGTELILGFDLHKKEE